MSSQQPKEGGVGEREGDDYNKIQVMSKNYTEFMSALG